MAYRETIRFLFRGVEYLNLAFLIGLELMRAIWKEGVEKGGSWKIGKLWGCGVIGRFFWRMIVHWIMYLQVILVQAKVQLTLGYFVG